MHLGTDYSAILYVYLALFIDIFMLTKIKQSRQSD